MGQGVRQLRAMQGSRVWKALPRKFSCRVSEQEAVQVAAEEATGRTSVTSSGSIQLLMAFDTAAALMHDEVLSDLHTSLSYGNSSCSAHAWSRQCTVETVTCLASHAQWACVLFVMAYRCKCGMRVYCEGDWW